MQIKGYTLVDKQKAEKAVLDAGEGASPELVLALYDKNAGYIKVSKDHTPVKTGTFWDFDEGKPRPKPLKVSKPKPKKVAKSKPKAKPKKKRKSKKSKK